MIFTGLEVGPLQTNCYIVGDETTKDAAVIDPGGDAARILALLEEHRLRCMAVVITHAHFDHVGACAELKEKTGAQVITHSLEKDALPMQGRMAMFFGAVMKDPPPPDRTVEDGETIAVGSISMKVIHTPGHSPGGICLAIEPEKIVIVGDTLFADSIGRTDFPGGSYEELIEGIRRKIFPLGDDWKVYPGHGPATTVGHERKHNPFF